jgi:hypothetical protein|tara:strand:+ start:530 stop:1129 length:600 start_codon:yes stop_codon:yes gene_type:complete
MATRKRVPKGKTSREWRFYPSERDADKCRAALATYDAKVRAAEVKWGIDRLPLLVEADLRDRFWAQMDVLNKAIDKGSGVEVEEAVASTIRGVEALERRAIELGAEPVSGEVWEETTPKGAVVAVCRDRAEIAKIRDSGRIDRVYAMSEIAAIVEAFEEGKAGETTKKVKSLFEGATIDSVKKKSKEEIIAELNDEIPF